jgi:hypothetical protein
MKQRTPPPTPDQRALVRWTASLGAVTAEALAHRLGVSLPSARARLVAAQRRRLLTCERPLAGRPALFALTRAGLHACHIQGIQTCRVTPTNANHLIVCAAVAAALERCYTDHRVLGERELRRDERAHRRSLASARLARASVAGGSGLHRPDLVLWPDAPPTALPVAVEVELTVKAPRRLIEICRAWARCRTVCGVLYVAPPDVRRALTRAITVARAEERITIVSMDAVLGADLSA